MDCVFLIKKFHQKWQGINFSNRRWFVWLSMLRVCIGGISLFSFAAGYSWYLWCGMSYLQNWIFTLQIEYAPPPKGRSYPHGSLLKTVHDLYAHLACAESGNFFSPKLNMGGVPETGHESQSRKHWHYVVCRYSMFLKNPVFGNQKTVSTWILTENEGETIRIAAESGWHAAAS